MLSVTAKDSTSILDLIAQHLDIRVPKDFSVRGAQGNSSSDEIALLILMLQSSDLLNFIIWKLDIFIK